MSKTEFVRDGRTEFVRDGRHQILGSETQLKEGDVIVRDRDGRILGRTSKRFGNTRDANGNLVSRNADDPGLLFRK